MTNSQRPLTDRDSFQARLTELLEEAETNGVDVTGAYDCMTATNQSRYDIQVSTVRR